MPVWSCDLAASCTQKIVLVQNFKHFPLNKLKSLHLRNLAYLVSVKKTKSSMALVAEVASYLHQLYFPDNLETAWYPRMRKVAFQSRTGQKKMRPLLEMNLNHCLSRQVHKLIIYHCGSENIRKQKHILMKLISKFSIIKKRDAWMETSYARSFLLVSRPKQSCF